MPLALGYVVCGQLPDRKRESGFEHIPVSAVFDEPAEAQNAYEYAKPKGVVQGCDYFVTAPVPADQVTKKASRLSAQSATHPALDVTNPQRVI